MGEEVRNRHGPPFGHHPLVHPTATGRRRLPFAAQTLVRTSLGGGVPGGSRDETGEVGSNDPKVRHLSAAVGTQVLKHGGRALLERGPLAGQARRCLEDCEVRSRPGWSVDSRPLSPRAGGGKTS